MIQTAQREITIKASGIITMNAGTVLGVSIISGDSGRVAKVIETTADWICFESHVESKGKNAFSYFYIARAGIRSNCNE